jgi:hypothetical protein
VTADADVVSGTLVFSSESSTVVTDAGERRDARSPAGDREDATAGGGARPGSRRSAFDLPPIDEGDESGGGLVN